MNTFVQIIFLFVLVFISCNNSDNTGDKTLNKADRPNIILLMADDLGWGDVGFNGNTIIKTPGLDKMASSGLVFNRFYSAGPVCSPTRGSCLTGRHPYRYGIYFANVGVLKNEEIALAEVVKKEGYTTGHFGKWHLGAISNTIDDGRRGGLGTDVFCPPWENGFDECFSTEQAVPTWNPMENQKLPKPTRYWTGEGIYETENLEGDDSRVIMDRAIPFMQKAANSNQPFFTVIWFHTPHSPVVAGPEYLKMYSEVAENKQHYYGCITALDEQIERLNKELKRMGIDQNTLITFCSDNGPAGVGGGIKQEPGKRQQGITGGLRGRKGSLYEGGVRVPGIIVWPSRIAAGQRTDFPAVTSDYFPTILNILGIQISEGRPFDGIDLMPALNGEQNERPGFIGFQSQDQKSIITERYKLIMPNKTDVELYDLKKDGFEQNNIANSKPKIVETLSKNLDQWITSCKQSDEGGDY